MNRICNAQRRRVFPSESSGAQGIYSHAFVVKGTTHPSILKHKFAKDGIGTNFSFSPEKYLVGEIQEWSPYSRNNRESQPAAAAAVSKELIATCAVLSGSAHARWEGADTEGGGRISR